MSIKTIFVYYESKETKERERVFLRFIQAFDLQKWQLVFLSKSGQDETHENLSEYLGLLRTALYVTILINEKMVSKSQGNEQEECRVF